MRYCSERALTYSLDMDFIEGQRDAHQILKQVFTYEGNHQQALQHAEQEKYLDDSLFSLKRISHIKSLEKKQVEEMTNN